MICPRCGQANTQGAPACARCGLALTPGSPEPGGVDGPERATPPDLRRGGYSSPLGRGAEPVEAVWREELAADHTSEHGQLSPFDAPASLVSPESPASRPSAQPNPPLAPTDGRHAEAGAAGFGRLSNAPSADDEPPPWLADVMRAQGRPIGADAPPAPGQSLPPDGPRQSAAPGPRGGAGSLGAARLVQPPQAPVPPNAAGQAPTPLSARLRAPMDRWGLPPMPPTPGQSGAQTGQSGAQTGQPPGIGGPRLAPPRGASAGAAPPTAPAPPMRSGPLGPAGRMPDPRSLGLAPSDPRQGATNSLPGSLPSARPNPDSRTLSRRSPTWQTPGTGISGGFSSPTVEGGAPSGIGLPWVANARPPQAPSNRSAIAQPPLPPGTLLKGGRYRLLQRWLPERQPLARADEPPLLVASVTESPAVRVLIQELVTTGNVGASQANAADHARQVIANRLIALSADAHFPTLLDNFSERGRQFLVFESPAGDLLSDRIARARGPLPEREVVEYGLRVLDALMTLEHGRPALTHGALCPTHIVLRPSGVVTLIGFSPSVLVAMPEASGEVVTVGAPSGIVGYAAPEQDRGQASARSDIYALGAIMSYAATGVAPSPQSSALPPPVRRLNPALSQEFEEVVGRAMRPAAAQRYPSAEAMRLALQSLTPRGRTSLPDLTAAGREATNAHLSLTVSGGIVRRVPRPRNMFWVFGMVVAVIALIVGGLAVALTHFGAPTLANLGGSAASTPNPSAALYQQNGIGISSGEFTFDAGGADAYDKAQAVRALAAGDQSQAYADYLRAVAASPADAEAAIYAENLTIALNHFPSVTLAVGVAFDGETAQVGATEQDILARDQLQGVYQAQENANAEHTLPGGERVRVLILNSGLDPNDTAAVAQLLAAQIRAGNPRHIIGLVSWPGAGQTRAAAAALHGTGLPMLGTAIGVDGLGVSGAPPTSAANYFAIVPTLTQQGAELANAAAQQLSATHILVAENPQDPSSVAMAQGFEQQLIYLQQHQIAYATVTSQQSFTPGSAASYAAIAQQASSQTDSLVFLSGADQDALALAQAAHHLGATYHILVGAQADTPSLLGQGVDPLAQTARQNAAALALLYVTTFANANEALVVNAANSTQALFEANYLGVFGHMGVPSGLPDPDPQTLLAYDAMTTLLTAAAPHNQGTAVYPTLQQMQASLLTNNGRQGFPAVSGLIMFGPDGGQPQKAMAILSLAPLAAPAVGAPVVTISLIAVVGGEKVYCGVTACD